MGIFDSAKDALNSDQVKNLVNDHEEKIDQGVEKAGDFIDEKSGGKFEGQIDQAQSAVEDRTGNL